MLQTMRLSLNRQKQHRRARRAVFEGWIHCLARCKLAL